MMNIPVAGTYHTDIPQYVLSLTNDDFLEKAAWSYMIWFYGQMEEVMVPSVGTREQLTSRGLPPERMKPLPRWVAVRRESSFCGRRVESKRQKKENKNSLRLHHNYSDLAWENNFFDCPPKYDQVSSNPPSSM
jgi:hypothetical protein